MTYMRLRKKAGGFTMVELMIATAVFSVVLLLCATAIVQVGQMFYKGTVINRTQNTARVVSEDVIQAIQFGIRANAGFRDASTSTFSYGGNTITVRALCLGKVRYSYILSNSLISNAQSRRSLGGDTATQSPHVLWKDYMSDSDACTPRNVTQASLSGGTELLSGDMRIAALDAQESAGVWTVSVTVSYGASDDLFVQSGGVPDYTQCANGKGSRFCSVSIIGSKVAKRL